MPRAILDTGRTSTMRMGPYIARMEQAMRGSPHSLKGLSCHSKGDLLLHRIKALEQRHGMSVCISFDGEAWDGSMSQRLLSSIERTSYASVFDCDSFDEIYVQDLPNRAAHPHTAWQAPLWGQ